ncbi:hypothetical protein [Candidatus Nitrosacidococcus sp. I8]|uniref:hypothetical protein n=1 Tax=Candidatus Nitrosacidococcus sp. I8 TaxID=2942908 RepID=UPI002227DC75|nr:hypothetical protein [Candidatus Nitrosacidococcus sp. I8]CAH9018725.1 hypothetical protein NURINAE_01097 [Candidatus Nitrosacidococcus sp. I8]
MESKTNFLKDKAITEEKDNSSAVLKAERTPGLSRGKGIIAHDFDAPLPEEILKEFEK